MDHFYTGALHVGGNSDQVAGAAALRLHCALQPVGGDGARVMPPTYQGKDERGNEGPVYIREERRFGDEEAPRACILLDSIASQANRLEEALLASIQSGERRIPDIVVDQGEFGEHSALEFSHRVFDAWVEDSLLDGDPFGGSELYAQLSSVINRGVAMPLLRLFPVGLLLGCWASRKSNPQGTTRIARAVTSEVIAVDAVDGQRPASRIDRHHVSSGVKAAVGDDDERFRILDEGASTKGVELVGKGEKAGKPSALGYGNVTPTVAKHGGITMSHALQQTVISLPAIRAVRANTLGEKPNSTPERDLAARELLVALALAMLESQVELGWDLRSGCQLVPSEEPTIELVGRLGDVVESRPLHGLGAAQMLDEAIGYAGEHDLDWDVEPLRLVASEEQLKLLRRSLGSAEGGEDGAE
jgi:CRISPR-associated protein Csb1